MTRLIITFMITASLMVPISSQNLKKQYQKEVSAGLRSFDARQPEILTREDIAHLPEVVRRYIEFTGALGREKVHHFKIEFSGKMRSDPGDGWMKFKSVQYNFLEDPVRAFYMKARKMGIPANGFHLYKNERAFMKVKLMGMFTIIDLKGPEMDQSETVTFLNDICFFAPGALIYEGIEWEESNDTSVIATLSVGEQKVSARLVFDKRRALMNFISDDRYEQINGNAFIKRQWYTPVDEYGFINGMRLAVRAKAYYKRDEADFCYGTFQLKEVAHNHTRQEYLD